MISFSTALLLSNSQVSHVICVGVVKYRISDLNWAARIFNFFIHRLLGNFFHNSCGISEKMEGATSETPNNKVFSVGFYFFSWNHYWGARDLPFLPKSRLYIYYDQLVCWVFAIIVRSSVPFKYLSYRFRICYLARIWSFIVCI